MSAAVVNYKSNAPGASDDRGEMQQPTEKQKLGHRRIDEQGEVSYKKVPTNALMSAIQLGIANSIGSLASRPDRDLLLQDFEKIENVAFPAAGSATTPSHSFGDFRFKTYAPIAFRYFRELFNIKPVDFLRSTCTEPLRELSNAGASGSIFYVSQDDQFIIKTVQHKEAEFLQKLLPGYYMNLQQNPKTLLPKFFGLFCYQSLGKNIRLLVMNNLLPQNVTMHEKYDLKGSTYKRLASKSERAKVSPTLKDLDFIENHPNEGLSMDAVSYDSLIRTISRDCLVLESFKIMDYSLLVGIHNVELTSGGRSQPDTTRRGSEETMEHAGDLPSTSKGDHELRKRPLQSKFSVWDQSEFEGSVPPGGVPARNSSGDRLILFLGIIDILQNYRLLKKMEHTWKAILHDGDSISVHNPNFYAQRFLSFMTEHVFKKGPADARKTNGKFRTLVHSYLALKQSPSRRRARKSIGDDDALITTRELVPAVSVGVPRAVVRGSSHRNNVEKKEKKVERLFASSHARIDEREPLQEEEDEFIFAEREPSMTTLLLLNEIPFIDDA